MRETEFIRKNKKSWEELELLLKASVVDPDRLETLFVKVSGDLSYARTFYPNRSVRIYLNGLLHRVFDFMQRPKKRTIWESIQHFYFATLPEKIIRYKYAFILSFVVFAMAVLIGVFSTLQDIEFSRLILGDQYVTMTENNIADKDPMAVYKDANKGHMFLYITQNNIRVAFFAFVSGVFAAFGSIFILIYNGIMVGVFQTFFFQKDLLMTSFLTIWIHGTIEISSIVISGAAGLIMGSGLLFPKSYSRSVSLRRTAIDGLIVMLSILPLFIIAGFLEGYVTRMTDLPSIVKAGIILVSLALMLYVYVYIPWNYYKSGRYTGEEREVRSYEDLAPVSTSPLRVSVSCVVERFGDLMVRVVLPCLLVFGSIQYAIFSYDMTFHPSVRYVFLLVVVTFFALWSIYVIMNKEVRMSSFVSIVRKNLLMVLCIGLLLVTMIALYTIEGATWGRYIVLFLPLSAIAHGIRRIVGNGTYSIVDFTEDVRKNYTYIGRLFFTQLIVVGIIVLFQVLVSSSILMFVVEYLQWHEIFDTEEKTRAFFSTLIHVVLGVVLFVFSVIYLDERYNETIDIQEARDLRIRFDQLMESKG